MCENFFMYRFLQTVTSSKNDEHKVKSLIA